MIFCLDNSVHFTFVLNLDDYPFKPSDIADILKRKPKEGLQEVIGIKDGNITQIFPP